MTYIFSAKRTPFGSFQGQLSQYAGWQLAAEVLKTVTYDEIYPTEVVMGCVLMAGQGQAPTRQAVKASFPTLGNSLPATTINKVCGSSMKAIMVAHDRISCDSQAVIIAGGFESMTNAPFLLPKMRSGQRMGHTKVLDHMLLDGLEDAYDMDDKGDRRSMGSFADQTAQKYQLSRSKQEDFAKEGLVKYNEAEKAGILTQERIELKIPDPKGGSEVVIGHDEPPTRVKVEKFLLLKPSFSVSGTVTAATSSSIADGAAAVLLGSIDGPIAKAGYKPLAKIVGQASHAQSPETFTLAPIGAIKKLLGIVGWNINEVDLFEVNEAFAVVPLAVIKELSIAPEKMNVHGGACTLGHPIGASGARLVVTLINALKSKNLRKGIAAVCIGGGEATALAIELC